LGLSQLFRAVYGSELDGSKAAKGDLIAHVLRAESLSPSETLMIGDRAHDVFGAKANGVFSIGVLWVLARVKSSLRQERAVFVRNRRCLSRLCHFLRTLMVEDWFLLPLRVRSNEGGR
jgi:phosphoglycolate phosphatase-like HAD superfamily hydrolase